MDTIEKTVLTLKDVRKDQNSRAIAGAIAYGFACLPVVAFAVSSIISGIFQAIIYGIILLGLALIPGVKWVKCIRYLLRTRGTPKMVVGKRIEAPEMSPFPVYDKYSENKFLYFENYGWFPSPGMDCPDVDRAYHNASFYWWDSKVGDEFYLLLDSENHVIHIYPCNKYEYTGPLAKHSIVNGRIQMH